MISDKEIIQHLFNLFFQIKDKNEANAQSFAILSSIEKLGYYDNSLITPKQTHEQWFRNYIETLGMECHVNEHFGSKILKDVLRVL